MSVDNNLLSLQEVSDFLDVMDKKKCPWCDGNAWGIHISQQDDSSSLDLRNLPHMKLYIEDGGLKGTVNIGTSVALPLIAAECKECGYLYLFNYFSVMRLARKKQEASVGNGDNS